MTSYWDENMDMINRKLEINGQDVLQKTWNDGRTTQLDWAYEDQSTGHHYLYTLSSMEGDVPAEKLIRIAKTIIPKAASK